MNKKKEDVTDSKIYFQNKHVFDCVIKFMELFDIEMIVCKSNIIFRERGCTDPIIESQLIEGIKKG